MAKSKVYFRADGNARIGLGHVTRSLALAEMLSGEYECHFIIRDPAPDLSYQIGVIAHSVIELPETDAGDEEAAYLASSFLTGEEIVVLDGYHFNTAYQSILKSTGCKVVCIDDIHEFDFVADVVINQAPSAVSSQYSVEPHTRLCLGLDYSLLRKPFLEAASKARTLADMKSIFICFGGADLENLSLKVLKAIVENEIKIDQVNVVLGSVNKFSQEIKVYVAQTNHPKINLQFNLSASDMCELMNKSDLAIVPASGILYEVTAVKMVVISGYSVDNQIGMYNGFRDLELIYAIGNLNEVDDFASIIEQALLNKSTKMLELQGRFQKGQSKEQFLKLFGDL